MFKTETHLHTKEVSTCGRISADEVVRMYSKAGYDTLFVTNHINRTSFDAMGDIAWADKIDKFYHGYRLAKAAGDELGVIVLPGAEIALNGNDYLVYGFNRDFLLGWEGVYKSSIEEFYPYAKEHGVIVIQAHPSRIGKNFACHPTPLYVDGMEVYNGHPRHENRNALTYRIAKECGLIMTAGSDTHQADDVASAYMLSEKRIQTAQDYISMLKAGELTLSAMEK